ncbi:hypothetical protein [Thermotomaculum hydrothermale]|uniref:hypothetical protein n=1 Tax=Thermotomaculum hydrothermale TaxID=981385 RepID=UPI0019165845|nr:hypothetical protein [Thermotomaculum hydrothermale]
MKLKFNVTEDGKKQIIVDLNETNKGKNFPEESQPLEKDFSMVGDIRYFAIERFNYLRRYAI